MIFRKLTQSTTAICSRTSKFCLAMSFQKVWLRLLQNRSPDVQLGAKPFYLALQVTMQTHSWFMLAPNCLAIFSMLILIVLLNLSKTWLAIQQQWRGTRIKAMTSLLLRILLWRISMRWNLLQVVRFGSWGTANESGRQWRKTSLDLREVTDVLIN